VAHPLALALDGAIRGDFPVPDGGIEVVGAPPDGTSAIVGFTAHSVIALDVDAVEVARRVNGADLGVALSPDFVHWVAARTKTTPGTHDVLLAAFAVPGDPVIELERVDALKHSRVARAIRHREDARIYVTPDRAAVLVLGRGLTRRWELAFEVDDDARGKGLGRRLAATARTLLPEGTPLWAQVAPGNAQSLRAVLAAGFRPIGAEILFM
jgi:GNAT superfamily N-acetyltransferase